MPPNPKNRRGFTLIELLVVTSIIGLLSSVVFASVNTARAKARDATRMQNLKQISLAIELYYSKNGNYPQGSGWCTQISNPLNNWGTNFQTDIGEWMPKVPLDPVYANTYQDYIYWNVNDQSYYLYAELEATDRENGTDGIGACARIGSTPNTYDYRIPVFTN
ncbi:MAG: type II secretion system protein [Candidatus Paceibacterota bacterium]|jgi:type II secretion system protein G